MIIQDIITSKELFIAALSFAFLAFFWSFGGQILKELRRKEDPSSKVSRHELNRYFMEKGYVVLNITPVNNTSRWLVFIIKNGVYEVATVYTNGEIIEGHECSVA